MQANSRRTRLMTNLGSSKSSRASPKWTTERPNQCMRAELSSLGERTNSQMTTMMTMIVARVTSTASSVSSSTTLIQLRKSQAGSSRTQSSDQGPRVNETEKKNTKRNTMTITTMGTAYCSIQVLSMGKRKMTWTPGHRSQPDIK